MEVKKAPQEWLDVISSFPHEVTTMQDFYCWTVRIFGEVPYLGYFDEKNYTHLISRRELHERALLLGSRLIQLGFKAGERVGVYCENRIESAVFLEAAQLYGFIVVFSFDPGLNGYAGYTFSDAGISVLYISAKKINKLETVLESKIPTLRMIIVNEDFDHGDIDLENIDIMLYDELMSKDKVQIEEMPKIDKEDICTICYSSGTLGAPKGVKLSHHAMLYAIYTIIASVDVREWIIHVSFLPIAHILERITFGVIMGRGGRIIFSSTGVSSCFEDMKRVHATGGPIIPFVLTKLHSSIMDKIKESKVKTFAMKSALYLQRLTRKLGFRSRIADTFVFDKIKKQLGGNLEWFVVAGDTLSSNVHQELTDILDIKLITIYGLSECGGPVGIADKYDIVPGTVGCLAPGFDIAFDEKNEILIKGPTMFSGYWNNKEITEQCMINGMFKSGDIGSVDPNGYLIVTGRSADIFEYSEGFKLAIPYLCFTYMKSDFVSQIFITPYKEKKCLLAIIVPPASMVKYGLTVDHDITTEEELYKLSNTKRYTEWARKYLRQYARWEKLPPSGYLAAIRHVGHPFTIEDGLLTATGKQRTNAFLEKFANEIKSMKEEVDQRRLRKQIKYEQFEYESETS